MDKQHANFIAEHDAGFLIRYSSNRECPDLFDNRVLGPVRECEFPRTLVEFICRFHAGAGGFRRTNGNRSIILESGDPGFHSARIGAYRLRSTLQ
jgi:hypothetical protein